MEDYFPARLKRKDLEDVSDDFSDFSLSSPPRKIRRLDAELPPIIEEEECEIPIQVEQEQSLLNDQSFVNNYSGGIRIEEFPNEPSNDDRAIVLFKPMNNNPLPKSASSFSVSPNLISGFKNQVLLSSCSNPWKQSNDEETENDRFHSGNQCLAVVPWVPSQLPSVLEAKESLPLPEVNNSEMMDSQEVVEEATTMDVEDCPTVEEGSINGADMTGLAQRFHQRQQQHCLIPQLPQNSTMPIVWYH